MKVHRRPATSPRPGGAPRRPSAKLGYRWDPDVFDRVMKRFGLGDREGLLKMAAALDDGNRYLSETELTRAGRKGLDAMMGGFGYSERDTLEVLNENGLRDEHALLRAASGLDDGDRRLERGELEDAARVLKAILKPYDLKDVHARLDALASKPGVEVTALGSVSGQSLRAVHLPCTREPPAMRVIVTAGVHGNEPCGPGAAYLLLERLLANPELREQVDFRVVTLVNPRAYLAQTRETPEGLDANRSIDPAREGPAEADLVERFLEQNPCDLLLDLHSAHPGRNGFFVVQQGCERLLAPVIRRFGRHWPLLHGKDAEPYVLSEPGVSTSPNRGTVRGYARALGARWAATVEAPGSVSYLDQVLGDSEIARLVIERALRLVQSERAARIA